MHAACCSHQSVPVRVGGSGGRSEGRKEEREERGEGGGGKEEEGRRRKRNSYMHLRRSFDPKSLGSI